MMKGEGEGDWLTNQLQDINYYGAQDASTVCVGGREGVEGEGEEMRVSIN